MVSLRERNRRNAMRETQRIALAMFQKRGFDAVTVADVAEQAGMAASTVYRHFVTKEALILWDEHDPAIDQALERHLRHQRPLSAIRDALVETLGSYYDADLDFQLARIKYIYATTQLHAAAVEGDFRARDELAAGLRHFLSRKNKDAAPVIAGAAMVAVDVAMDRWQQNDGKKPLAVLLTEAFSQLEQLDQLT